MALLLLLKTLTKVYFLDFEKKINYLKQNSAKTRQDKAFFLAILKNGVNFESAFDYESL
ncbi:MAG: hypothetical protein JNL70_05840 [Saprospiraceae bacterium]|nr:hypothetical protein [Saprospiraceae bacterium]